jgi:DNA-binding transcriptional ArsR family regulator
MTKSIPQSNIVKVSELLQAIGPQPRLEILLALGTGEACVCHLEAATGWRQAYISQHLMALREAGIITARREGRFVFYRLQDIALLDLIRGAARLAGVPENKLGVSNIPLPACNCPSCAPVAPGNILRPIASRLP